MKTEWTIKWSAKRQKQKTTPSLLENIREDQNMSNLQLVTTNDFNGVRCDFYCNGNDYSNLWMSRKQIGQALEYTNPDDALYRIHERHKNRLDKYSALDKLSSTDGKAYETIVYNRRGIMEICRWSKQPKADEFMDWVWDLVEAYQDGKLNIAKPASSSSTPLDREELAAYMMYNSQIIDTYKASTDAVLQAIQEKDQAVLTQQLNCMKALTDFIKDFCAAETARSEKYSSLMENWLHTFHETSGVLNEPSVSHSALQIHAKDKSFDKEIWKKDAYSNAELIGKRLNKPKMKVLQSVYERMTANGVDFDAAIASYMSRYHIPKQQIGKINVVADDPALRTEFYKCMETLTSGSAVPSSSPVPKVKVRIADTRALPESVKELLIPLIPKYGDKLSTVASTVYKEMEEAGVPLDEYYKNFKQLPGHQKAYKGYAIAQDPQLMKVLKNIVDMMLGKE